MKEVNLYGYDVFIGRLIEYRARRKRERFVAIYSDNDLIKLDSFSHMFDFLCENVSINNAVLINQIPSSLEDLIDGKVKTIEQLKESQIKELEIMYELRIDLKLKANPFLYQPNQEIVKE